MRWDIVRADRTGWRHALALVHHDIYHLPEYALIEAERVAAEPVAFVASGGGRLWFVPLLLRSVPGTDRVDATSPYGYPGPLSNARTTDVLFFEDVLLALHAGLSSLGAVSCFLRLHPFLGPPLESFKRTGSLVVHGPTVVIDLSRSEQELWAGLRASHRTQTRRGHRAGLCAFEDVRWARLGEFVPTYLATMQRVGADEQYFFPLEYFEVLRGELGRAVHLLLVEKDGEVVAGGIYTETGGIVQYHLGATADEHLHLNPAKVLFDHATRWAKRRGNRWLHLGGGVGGADDSLFHFKAGFSPLRHTFATWRLVVDRLAYEQLAPGAAGSDEGSYFPAYRSNEVDAAPSTGRERPASISRRR